MKSRKLNIITLAIVLLIAGLLITAENTEEENFGILSATYSQRDTKAYGCFVLFTNLPILFYQDKINVTYQTIFENCKEEKRLQSFNYLFIHHTFKPNRADANSLMEFVYEGGQAFVAAESFQGMIADTFQLKTNRIFYSKDATSLHFLHPKLKGKSYSYSKGNAPVFFESFDAESAYLVAENDQQKPVMIRIPFGDGDFYFCTTPLAFTNYYLLKNQQATFASSALSFLPNQLVLWDEYYKTGRGESDSILRFVWSRKSLRSALYWGLLGIGIFIVFEVRRKQRALPVILPLQNNTLDFVKVIGRLYYQHKDHYGIAQKKINHFYDYLRHHYFIKINEPNEDVIEKIASKTNVSIQEIRSLFQMIAFINQKNTITEKQLIELNKKIEKVKGRKVGVVKDKNSPH